MAATESIGYQISGINNQITDDFGSDNDLEVTGGGKGWKATTTVDGEVYFAKGASKLAAAENLYDVIKNRTVAEDDPADVEEVEGCAAECQSSESAFCRCACGGANHGALVGRTEPVVLVGDKLCACGCGEFTKRTYVPGHDARHHGLLKLVEWAEANGVLNPNDDPTGYTETEIAGARKAKAAAVRKAARERRAKLRAAKDAKVTITAESLAKAEADGTVAPADDLPF